MSNGDTNNGDQRTPPPASRASSEATPTRPTNNYASINTPIASAKRPTKKRTPVPSSATKPMSTTSAGSGGSGGTPKTPIRTPKMTSNDNNNNTATTTTSKARYTNLSPMHNVKPVPRDSHHTIPATQKVKGGAASGADENGTTIAATESSLSIATEAPPPPAAAASSGGESPSSSNSASWVGRKVDAIFSPVLSFLNGASAGGEEEDGVTTSSLSAGASADVEGSGTTTSSSAKANLSSLLTKENSESKSEVENEEVQKMVREALLQAKSDLQKEEEYNNSTRTRTDTFDDIPGMTNTDSSGSNIVDADGDVAMADCYIHQQRGEDVEKVTANDVTDYLKVTLNDHLEEEEEEEEGYYDDEEEDDEDEFNPYMFIKSLPPYEYALPPGWRSRPKALPPADPDSHPICLVLDLDETLVHCTVEPVADADMVFPVEFNGMNYQVHVRCRPFLTEFLDAVSRKFEVVIFTASQQVYADKLLDKIDPEGKYIRHRMFRDSCLPVEGNYLKDLTVLGRDLSKAVLVDNSPHAFGYQVDNGIPIESWFDDPKDKELLKLEKFLRTLHGVEDVRDVVRKTFQTHLLVRNA